MENEFKRPLAVSLAILYGSIAIFSVVCYLLSRDIAARVSDIVRARNMIQKNVSAVEVLANFKEIAAGIDTYETDLARLLPPEEQILDFPNWIAGVAQTDGVSITFSFQQGKQSPNGDAPGYVPFAITAYGSHAQVYKLFRDVSEHAAQFLVTFQDWDAVYQGNGGYQVRSSGRVYYK